MRTALEGAIERRGELVEVVNLIQRNQWTGALRVISSDGERAVFFKKGDVRAASSDAPGEKLGEILFRHGAVTAEELTAAVTEMSGTKRIGEILVERQVLTTHDLYHFLKEQMEEIFFSLVILGEGHFGFDLQDLPSTLPTQLRLATLDLVMAGVERTRELGRLRQDIPSLAMILERTDEPVDEWTLTPAEQILLEHLDGSRSLEELGRLGALNEYHLTKAAFDLLQADIVRPARAHRSLTAGTNPERLLLVDMVDTFNGVFSFIFEQAELKGTVDTLVDASASFFSEGAAHRVLFRGVSFGATGALDATTLLENLADVDADDPAGNLYDSLEELMFFASFAVDVAIDDETESRVRECLETIRILQGKAESRPR